MKNVINLTEERAIKTLITKLGDLLTDDAALCERTMELLAGDLPVKQRKKSTMKPEDLYSVSIRLPTTLVNKIDECARKIAFSECRKVTRNSLISEWLKASVERYETTTTTIGEAE